MTNPTMHLTDGLNAACLRATEAARSYEVAMLFAGVQIQDSEAQASMLQLARFQKARAETFCDLLERGTR